METASDRHCLTSEYYANVISSQAANVPTEVLHPVIKGLFAIKERNGEEVSQCPKCFTPWMQDCHQSRLSKRPGKTQLVKTLMRKERRNRHKLSQNEKLKLSLFRTQRNTLRMVCLTCRHVTKSYCALPEKMRKPVKAKEKGEASDMTAETNKKKKKKRRKKEQNAGLLISSSSCKSSKSREGKDKTAERNQTASGNPKDISASGETSLRLCPPERDLLSQRKVGDSIVTVIEKSRSESKLLTQSRSKRGLKEREYMTKSLKSRIERDSAMDFKRDNTLASFLSSML